MKIAVIPARGGSKRIPMKNIRPFFSKPIIEWPIQTALSSELFDEVIVSTDNSEILRIATECGANAPFLRPPELSDDFTDVNDVVRHSIDWVSNNLGHVEYVCCIFATAAFVTKDQLWDGYRLLVTSRKSYAFTVTRFEYPIQRAITIRDNLVATYDPENFNNRSQDLQETYHDAGQFYWGTAEAFMKGVEVFSTESVPIVLPRYLAHDIDTVEDWETAELMYQILTQGNSSS